MPPVFVVIILLGSEAINHLLRDRDLAQAVQSRAGMAEDINDIVHQLQRERGYSSGFLASDGRYLVHEMARERQITDRIVTVVWAKWTQRQENLVPNEVLQTLSKVPDWRADIDAARASSTDVVARYTALVNDLLNLTSVKSITVSQDALPFLIETRQAIAQAKEAAGLQRAAGSMALGAQAMDADLHRRFLSLSAREDTYLALAHIVASAAERPLKTLKTVQFERMDAVQQQLVGAGYDGDLPDISAADWFKTSSAWVDRLRAEENRLNAEIAHVSRSASEDARDALILRGPSVLFALLLLAHQVVTRNRQRHHLYVDSHG